MSDVYQAMEEMYYGAIKSRRTPRRWELNAAAKMEIMSDERFHRDHIVAALQQKFFGVPTTPWTDHWYDADPKVRLIVDEEKRTDDGAFPGQCLNLNKRNV